MSSPPGHPPRQKSTTINTAVANSVDNTASTPKAPHPSSTRAALANRSPRNTIEGDSEAETDVLPEATILTAKSDAPRGYSSTESERGKRASEGGQRKWARGMDADADADESDSRSRGVANERKTRGRPPKRREQGADQEDDSSDLSSAPSPSSRTGSPPSYLVHPHLHHHNRHHRWRAKQYNGRLRRRNLLGSDVAPTGVDPSGFDTENSDDDTRHGRPRRRKRRRSLPPDGSPPPRLVIKSSPQVSPHPSSPLKSNARITKKFHAGQHTLKQRKFPPPPLKTSREKDSGGEALSSSPSFRDRSPSSSSRSPRRHQSTIRTPGSPVSRSHKPRRDTAGRTHLHRACQRGAVSEVKTILSLGKEFLNEEDNAGYMPLHEACLYGHLDVVKVLLNNGAWLDVPSRIELDTPLLDAVDNGHADVVKYLLEIGADPRKRNKQGQTALDANDSNRDFPEKFREIEDLLKVAINKLRSKRSSDDENPRASAPADSHSSRDPSVASPIHQSPHPTPLPTATRRRNARTEQSRKDLLWLDAGKNGLQNLRELVREGDQQLVHALLERGTKPDAESLICAIKGGHTDTVSLLLAYNAIVDPDPGNYSRDGNRKNRDTSTLAGEETPMLAAIGRGNLEVLRYLLANGVNPRRLDYRGKSYAEIAREREGEFWPEEVDMLKKAWDIALPISDGDADKSAGEADISDSDTDVSDSGSILSVVESIFGTASSQSSASSISQVPRQAREQAEDVIASVLAKSPGVSVIVAKGVDKLREQGVERLMANALRQFSSAIKSSLGKDKPLLRDSFTFIELRAVSIARKIRELTQSKSPATPDQSAIKKYLEDTRSHKVPLSDKISSWQNPGEPLTLHGSEDTDAEDLGELNEEGEGEELGENLLQQITEYLASDKAAGDFLCAVKDNFLKGNDRQGPVDDGNLVAERSRPGLENESKGSHQPSVGDGISAAEPIGLELEREEEGGPHDPSSVDGGILLAERSRPELEKEGKEPHSSPMGEGRFEQDLTEIVGGSGARGADAAKPVNPVAATSQNCADKCPALFADGKTDLADSNGQETTVQLLVDDPQAPLEARRQGGDVIAPPISDGGSDISDCGSIVSKLSTLESIFSTELSESSASSASQVNPLVREQAEYAIATILVKNTSVSIIVTRGVGKLGQQRAERLMAKALKQFSSAIKSSLDKDKPVFRRTFDFLEQRAVQIARKIRELIQSDSDTILDKSDLERYLEENHRVKIPFHQNIEGWQDSEDKAPRGLDGGELGKPEEVAEDKELYEPNEVETFHEPGKYGELISPGGILLQQVSDFLASNEVLGHFVFAVENEFLKVNNRHDPAGEGGSVAKRSGGLPPEFEAEGKGPHHHSLVADTSSEQGGKHPIKTMEDNVREADSAVIQILEPADTDTAAPQVCAGKWPALFADGKTDIQFDNTNLQSFSNDIKGWIEKFIGAQVNWWPLSARRTDLLDGFWRVKWKCRCGRRLESIISTARKVQLERWISACSDQPPAQSAPLYPIGMDQGGDIGLATSSGRSNDAPPPPPPSLRQCPSRADGAGRGTSPSVHGPTTTRHLLWCVTSGLGQTVVRRITVAEGDRDEKVFKNLREEYHQTRGFWRRMSLHEVSEIRYVRFRKFLRDRVTCSPKQELPKHDDLDYEYYPKGEELEIPPIPVEELVEYFRKPSCAGTLNHAIESFPKKLSEEITKTAWGLHAYEKLSLYKILCLMGLVLAGNAVFVSYWLWGHPGDLQNAFVPPFLATTLAALCIDIYSHCAALH